MDRRQEILEAAAKSFSLFGYKATTMDQVAKIANVGKGTIYTFFANKEELFNAIVVKMINEMRAEADAVSVEGAPFEQNAHARLMQMLKFRGTHQLYAKLIDEEKELRTPAVGEVLQAIEKEIVFYVKEKIEKGLPKVKYSLVIQNLSHICYLRRTLHLSQTGVKPTMKSYRKSVSLRY